METVMTLIRTEAVRDSDGYTIKTGENSREIFAKVSSPTRMEFYQSYRAGIETTKMFEIWEDDYEEEKLCEHEGKRYRIIRTYARTNGRLELYVTDAGQVQ